MNRTQPKPLEPTSLRALALFYAGRYATTQGGLVRYLSRKLRERGWHDGDSPDLSELANEFARLGYVDDRAVAEAKVRSLKRRGMGAPRIRQALGDLKIAPELSDETLRLGDGEEFALCIAFARRKRIGPFAKLPGDEHTNRRWLATMARAGHHPGISRSILALSAEQAIELLNQCD
jgi:regulatory protein